MQMVSSFTITEPSPADNFFRREVLEQDGVTRRQISELTPGFFRERELPQRNQLQAILRADVHAAAAKNALRSVGFVAFENGVDPAAQAAGGLQRGPALPYNRLRLL